MPKNKIYYYLFLCITISQSDFLTFENIFRKFFPPWSCEKEWFTPHFKQKGNNVKLLSDFNSAEQFKLMHL